MKGSQVALLLVGQALLLLTLAGLWRRRRLSRLWMLPVHLVATALWQVLTLVLPDVFRVWRVWAVRELVLHVVTLGIVAEVAWRAFANLPRERRHARIVLGIALLIPLVLVALTPWRQGELAAASWLYVLVAEIMPRLTYGAGFVCLALVWAMARRLVPADPLHAVVVLGLCCYLFVYSISFGHVGQGGPQVLAYVVTPVTYALLLVLWTWAAWRTEPTPDAPLHVRRTLQPWRG